MAKGFRYVFNDYGKDPTRITEILLKDNESGFTGEAVKIDKGRATKAGAKDEIAGFLTSNIAAGKDKRCEIILAREGDWYDVPFTGTADAGFVSGANTIAVAADGLSADAATVIDGALSVLEINKNKKTCRVKVKKRQFS
ncbi:hypothetical protein M3661_28900 [Paenibacillus sp. MER 180]|uniref:Uncharacterized protein n=1 Tax=Paenibacillus alvei TaxID=44250 RepID=A0ABT4EA07_PAEAL|nr:MULTISPECIES: hypothetical protein [Paenibacillus]MCM3294119.1 hypothetical protein [Paenibacillus sp. MER 180]MCY9530572.1 hypothetical protein [Paenibacillus alvei]